MWCFLQKNDNVKVRPKSTSVVCDLFQCRDVDCLCWVSNRLTTEIRNLRPLVTVMHKSTKFILSWCGSESLFVVAVFVVVVVVVGVAVVFSTSLVFPLKEIYKKFTLDFSNAHEIFKVLLSSFYLNGQHVPDSKVMRRSIRKFNIPPRGNPPGI